jgi:hypothetical protein
MRKNKITFNKIIKQNLYVLIFYYFSWYFTFHLIIPFEKFLFSSADLVIPSLIFLPHGIRIISSIAYGIRIFPGLLLAHIITGLFFVNNIYLILNLSITSVLSVYFAIYLVLKKFSIKDISEISLKNILFITLISSLINSTGNSIITNLSFTQNEFIKDAVNYCIGDILGTLLLFYLIKYLNQNKILQRLIAKL